MSNKYSPAFETAVNALVKYVMNDFVVDVYDGAVPATAAAAATGNKLARFTKGGAALVGTASTKQDAYVVVTNGSTGDTVTFTFTVPSKTLVYTQVAGDTTDDIFTASCVAAINADTTLNKVVRAVAIGGAAITENAIYLEALYPGEPFTLTVGATGTCSAALTAGTSNVRINSIHFDYPNVDGDLVNEAAYTMQATGLIDGTATYFRAVLPTDTGGLVTTTEPRIQGNISTSGAEINLRPSNQIVVGQPLSISTYKIAISLSVT